MSTYSPKDVEVVAVAYDPVYDFSMVDGKAVAEPSVDRSSGKAKQRWALHWRRHKGGSNWEYGKVRVYNLHIDRTWSSQGFWERQDMQGLANTIMSVQSEEPVSLENAVPATVQYNRKGRSGYYTLLELGSHLNTQVSTPSTAPVAQQDTQQVQRNAADIAEIQSDMKQMMALMQQLVDKQK